MPGRPIAIAALLSLSLLVTGCDSGDSAATFTVVGTEMAFAAPSTVSAGAFTVVFRNDGAVFHELAFKDPSGQFQERRSIAAGKTAVVNITLTPGTWELGCFEPGHYEAGMYRPLVVTPTRQ